MEVWMEVGMVGVKLAWEADAREGVGEMGMPATLKRPGKHTKGPQSCSWLGISVMHGVR